MLAGHYEKMLQNKSVIRELSEFATARGKEIGYENVFDFSLGNPSVETPAKVNQAINVLPIDSIFTPVKKVNY